MKTSRNKPRFENIQILIKKLESIGISDYKIICDNSLFYHINDKKSYSKLVKIGKIIETPSGVEADIIILQFAYDKNSYIISNDKFREYREIFERKWINKVRISFLFIEDEIYLDKLIKLTIV